MQKEELNSMEWLIFYQLDNKWARNRSCLINECLVYI